MLRAILVAYEGVLVDGQAIDRRAWSRILGRTIAPGEWETRCAGREPREALLALLGTELVQPDRLRQLLAERAQHHLDTAKEGKLLAPGAADMIRAAAHLAPVGLFHRAPGPEVVAALKGAGLFDRFTALVPGGIRSALAAVNADLERPHREPASPRGTLVLTGERDAVAEARSLSMRVVAVGQRVGGADAQAFGPGSVDLDELARSLF